jgi:AcrR family transcriptional regulator
MPRNPQQSQKMREESRNQILKAAGHLFAQRGFARTRISDVAQAAGMSQGNVYWYFESKTHLLSAVLERGFNTVQEILEQAAGHDGPSIEALQILFERTYELYHDQMDFMRLLMATSAHSDAPHLDDLGFELEKIGLSYHQTLIPLMTRAQEEGVLPSADANMQVVLFFSFINGLILTYGEDIENFPVPEIMAAGKRLLGVEHWAKDEFNS